MIVEINKPELEMESSWTLVALPMSMSQSQLNRVEDALREAKNIEIYALPLTKVSILPRWHERGSQCGWAVFVRNKRNEE